MVILILMPAQFCLQRVSATFQKKMLKENDGRLKLVTELMQGIRQGGPS